MKSFVDIWNIKLAANNTSKIDFLISENNELIMSRHTADWLVTNNQWLRRVNCTGVTVDKHGEQMLWINQ